MDQQRSGQKICIPAVLQTLVKMAFNDSLKLCEEGKENYFMMLKLVDLLNAATKICPISCITTEYVGKLFNILFFIDKIYHIIDNFIHKKQGDQNEIYSV